MFLIFSSLSHFLVKPMTLYYAKIKSSKSKSAHIFWIGWLIYEKSGCLCLRNSVPIYESLRYSVLESKSMVFKGPKIWYQDITFHLRSKRLIVYLRQSLWAEKFSSCDLLGAGAWGPCEWCCSPRWWFGCASSKWRSKSLKNEVKNYLAYFCRKKAYCTKWKLFAIVLFRD